MRFACTTACAYLQLYSTSWISTKSGIPILTLFQWDNGREDVDPSYPMLSRTFQANCDAMITDDGACTKELLRSIAVILLEVWHQKPLRTWLDRRQGLRPTNEDPWFAPWLWFNETSHTILPWYKDALSCCLKICEDLGDEKMDEEIERRLCEDFLKPLIKSCTFWKIL